MARINENFLKLRTDYLFSEIARRTRAFVETNRGAEIIRLGGDITFPLVPAVVDAMREAAAEMGCANGIRGYGPVGGYPFLRETILEHDFHSRGVEIEPDEIFVSDGSKQDNGNLQELFGSDCRVAVTDPVYPVYVDANVMAGRTGEPRGQGRYAGVTYLACTAENGFTPGPPTEHVDLVYLCSPNNPTGAVFGRANLAEWVAWARTERAVIFFDAAYDAFIQDDSLPHSIYEIDGARECAIELRSFSKRAGFTGVRCAYAVVPRELMGETTSGDRVPMHDLWSRRQSTKFNEVPYVIQRGAAAVFSPDGRKQSSEQIAYYMENAKRLRNGLRDAGFVLCGGEHAPYIWLRGADGLSSWEFFDEVLSRAHVAGTPGAGFGPSGDGYLRLSAFNSRARVDAAVERICEAFAH